MAIEPTANERRLDRLVVAALERAGNTSTRSQLRRAFEQQQVQSQGRALKPSAKVVEPMEVHIGMVEPQPLRAEAQAIELDILHEDEDLLVINKCPGMPVHPGVGHPDGTLVNGLLHHLGVTANQLPVLPGNPSYRPGIVHRLDMNTSGVLVVAKHVAAQEFLAAQFRVHSLERQYVALVCGRPKWESRRVCTLHGRDPGNRMRYAVNVAKGAKAISHVRVAENHGAWAKCHFQLETGRTHQIRMHARHLGHPILGDTLYGGCPKGDVLGEIGQRLGRQALHAETLGFVHPGSKEKVTFQADMPDDMQRTYQELLQRES